MSGGSSGANTPDGTTMRILVFTHYFWPEEFRINDCVAGLVERGHEVTVVCGPPSYPQGEIYPAYAQRPESFTSYEGARVIRVPVLTRGRGGALRLMGNYLSAALSASTIGVWALRRSRFDVVFVFQPSPITTALPAILFKALKRTPIVMWVQDLWPDTLEALGVVRSRAGLRLVELLVRFVYAGCDRVLVQSRAFIDNVQRYAPSKTPLTYLPNWSDPAFLNPPSAPAPEVVDASAGFTIMFAGNLGEAQDLLTVVQAAFLCRDVEGLRWIVVGDGSARAATQNRVQELGIQDKVIFLGRHPSDRMPAFFAGADAMMLSLKAEPIFAMTIPSKLQSYMASGRPVLCMVEGEAAEVVKEAGCGFTVAAGDASGLAEAVRTLAALAADERSAMGENGRRFGQANFDRDLLIDRLESELSAAAGTRQ